MQQQNTISKTNQGLVRNLFQVALNVHFNTKLFVHARYNGSSNRVIIEIAEVNRAVAPLREILIDLEPTDGHSHAPEDLETFQNNLTAKLLHVIAVLHTASIKGQVNWSSLERGWSDPINQYEDRIMDEIDHVVHQYINWNGDTPPKDVIKRLAWYMSFDSEHDYNLPGWHSVDDILDLDDDEDWSDVNTFIEYTILRYYKVFNPAINLYSDDDEDTFSRYGHPIDE